MFRPVVAIMRSLSFETSWFISFRILWPCIVNTRWRERTNKMRLIRCLLSNFLSQHVSGIIMPIIRGTRPCTAACGVLPGRVGCGWLWSVTVRHSNFHTVHTAHDAAPQDHNQPQPTHPGRTPHSAGHGLVLLMTGIMMSETCWDRKFDNKHRISRILLVLSLFTLIVYITQRGLYNSKYIDNLRLYTYLLKTGCIKKRCFDVGGFSWRYSVEAYR